MGYSACNIIVFDGLALHERNLLIVSLIIYSTSHIKARTEAPGRCLEATVREDKLKGICASFVIIRVLK